MENNTSRRRTNYVNAQKNKQTEKRKQNTPEKRKSASKPDTKKSAQKRPDAKKTVHKKSQKKKRKNKFVKKLLSFLATAIVLVIIAYCGYGYIAYGNAFMPNYNVAGIDCGNMTSQDFINVLNNRINDYSLVIKKDGEAVEVIKASDVGISPSEDISKRVREIVTSQNKLLWGFCNIVKPEPIQLDNLVQLDEKKYNSFIVNSAGYNLPTTVENADQSMIFEDGQYAVSDPIYGDEIDKDAYYKKVKECILSLESELELKNADCYTKPNQSEDNSKYEEACRKANDIINYGSLKINAEGLKGDLAKEIIEASLVIDKDFNVTIDESTIANAVEKISKKYNTLGGTRKFNTSHGTVVEVKGGDYGCSLKLNGIEDSVEKALLDGDNVEKTVKYTQNVLDSSVEGIGNTYVEIDLTNQYVWVYKDSKLVVETPCITGLAGGARETPQGTYMLKNKAMDVPLVGTNYVTPVKYWMPFNGGIGLHDAVWQANFGGELYKTKGSHGCVNLPMDKAGEIYKNAVVKMPVVLYYDTRLPDKFKAVPSTGMVAGQYRSLTARERTMLANIKAGRPAGAGAIADNNITDTNNVATDAAVE